MDSPTSHAYRKPQLIDKEVLASRFDLLDAPDRDLAKAFWLFGTPASLLGNIAHRNRTTIQRRAKALLQRVSGARFVAIMRALRYMPEPCRTVCQEHFLAHLSLRTAAARNNLSLHACRVLAQQALGILNSIEVADRMHALTYRLDRLPSSN